MQIVNFSIKSNLSCSGAGCYKKNGGLILLRQRRWPTMKFSQNYLLLRRCTGDARSFPAATIEKNEGKVCISAQFLLFLQQKIGGI